MAQKLLVMFLIFSLDLKYMFQSPRQKRNSGILLSNIGIITQGRILSSTTLLTMQWAYNPIRLQVLITLMFFLFCSSDRFSEV